MSQYKKLTQINYIDVIDGVEMPAIIHEGSPEKMNILYKNLVNNSIRQQRVFDNDLSDCGEVMNFRCYAK